MPSRLSHCLGKKHMPSRLSPQAHHEKLLYIPIVSASLRIFIRPICLEKQWANLNNLGGMR